MAEKSKEETIDLFYRANEKSQRVSHSLKYISLGIQVATIFIAIILGLSQQLTIVEAVVSGTLFLILENLIVLVISRETIYPILKELNEKHILLRHQAISLSNWILRDQYYSYINNFTNNLSQLASGHFTLDLTDVPQLSIQVIRSLEKEAFTTVVVSETDQFFDTEVGRQYIYEGYVAAKRISGTFTRLFVIRDFFDITPRIFELLERHKKEGINVLVVTQNVLAAEGLNPKDDFGLWDQKCLMRLEATSGVLSAKLGVQIGGPLVEEALKRAKRLAHLSMTLDNFKSEMCCPVNERAWSSLLSRFQTFSPPVGPSQNDVKQMWELACKKGSPPERVLVLGYTQAIVNYFVQNGCREIHVVDVGSYQPQHLHQNVLFFEGNWLTWVPRSETYYDVIVGDDVVNNLGLWQYYIFFRNMATLLKPSGYLVMRAIGRYVENNEELPGFQATLNELKKLESVDEAVLNAKLLPMLHSSEFYDKQRKSFDVSEWNNCLNEARSRGDCSNDEVTKLRFDYPLELTSLPFSEFLEYTRKWFNLVEENPVDKSYIDLCSTLGDFYRIISFVKK